MHQKANYVVARNSQTHSCVLVCSHDERNELGRRAGDQASATLRGLRTPSPARDRVSEANRIAALVLRPEVRVPVLMAAPKNANTEAARAASLASRAADKRNREISAARILLREEGYLVYSRDEIAEMLTRPIHADGLSSHWLRGYLKIPNANGMT